MILITIASLYIITSLLYYLLAWFRGSELRHHSTIKSPIETLITENCGFRVHSKNSVRLLQDAGKTYSALIYELQHAKESIHLLYYIFDDDRLGQSISKILIRKAHAGIKVRIIYDRFGSLMPRKGVVKRLLKEGVEICAFRPLIFSFIIFKLTERNHRKLAIIDSRIAFIGGVNIAKRYLDGSELGPWRDMHLRIEGRVVDDLQSLFLSDWYVVKGERVRPVPPHKPHIGSIRMQILYSESGKSRHTLYSAILALFGSARQQILISTPYFTPPEPHLKSLCRAASMGIRVKLMLPARSDMRITAAAAESYFEELLNSGVEILLYNKGFLHTKMVVIDNHYAYIGSANLDYRSLLNNWEVGTIIYDRGFCRRAANTFSRDSLRCSRLTLEELKSRPILRRAAVGLARLLSPML